MAPAKTILALLHRSCSGEESPGSTAFVAVSWAAHRNPQLRAAPEPCARGVVAWQPCEGGVQRVAIQLMRSTPRIG